MTMKLYYSTGSPFARKIRIVLAEKALEFEKDEFNQLRTPEMLGPVNPNLQVPVLEDGDQCLFDSAVIVDYLLKTYPENARDSPLPSLAAAPTRPEQHWEDAKILTTIDALANSMVNLRQLQLCDVHAENVAYLQRQHSRIQYGLDWLETRATPEGFAPGLFSVMDLSLLCHLTFSEARGDIFPWRGRANLEAIVARYADRPSVKSTAPDPQPA
jgi:glutathione S-transferase